MFNFIFFIAGYLEVGGKPLNLLEFVGQETPQVIAVLVSQRDEEARLVVVGTDNRLAGISHVDNLAVNGRIAFRERQQRMVRLAVIFHVSRLRLQSQIRMDVFFVFALVVRQVGHNTLWGLFFNARHIEVVGVDFDSSLHTESDNILEIWQVSRTRDDLTIVELLGEFIRLLEVLAHAHVDEALPQLRHAESHRVAYLVLHVVADAVELFYDNIDVISSVRRFTAEKPVHVFADDILGLGQLTDARELAKQGVPRIVGELLAAVAEPLARVAGKHQVHLALESRQYLVGNRLNVGRVLLLLLHTLLVVLHARLRLLLALVLCLRARNEGRVVDNQRALFEIQPMALDGGLANLVKRNHVKPSPFHPERVAAHSRK